MASGWLRSHSALYFPKFKPLDSQFFLNKPLGNVSLLKVQETIGGGSGYTTQFINCSNNQFRGDYGYYKC